MSKIIVNIEDAVIVQNEIWFFTMNFNGLFSKTIEGIMHFHGSVPWEPIDGIRLYASIQKIGKKIYLIPCNAKSVAVYNIDTKTFSSIKLKHNNIPVSFMASTVYRNYLIMFGFFSPWIVRIDLNNNDIVYVDQWYYKAKKHIWDVNAPFFRRQLLIKDDRCLLPFFNANLLLEFNIKSLESKIYILGTEKRGYSGICEWNGKLVCLSYMKNNDLLIIGYDREKLKKYEYSDNFIKENLHFSGIINENGVMNLFALFGTESKKIYIMDKAKMNQGDYSFVREEGNNYYYYNRLLGEFVIIDKKNQQEIKENLEMDVTYSIIYSKNNLAINEENVHSLRIFLKCVQYKNDGFVIEDAANIGKRIYEYIT